MDQPTWTVSTLAGFLRKSVSCVYDNHEKQAIPSFRIGQQLRFRPSEVKHLLESDCRDQEAS